MMHTTNSVTAPVKLCEAAAGLPQDKAAIAAMMADAFINGMTMQARLTTDAAPRPESRT